MEKGNIDGQDYIVDADSAYEEFSKQALQIHTGIESLTPKIKEMPSTPSGDLILTEFRKFQEYFFDNGKLNEDRLKQMINTMGERIDVIRLKELTDSAKNLVDKAGEGDIVLFMPLDEYNESDFNSAYSTNSYEFMAKLVKKCAAKKGRSVRIITTKDGLNNFDNINMTDDAAFSGIQFSGKLTTLARALTRRTTVNIFLARSTERALENITSVPGFNKLTINIDVGELTRSLEQKLADKPEYINYFLTSMLVAEIESGKAAHLAVRSARHLVSGQTLTVSETSTPDFLSFPSRLSQAVKRGNLGSSYPNVNKVII